MSDNIENFLNPKMPFCSINNGLNDEEINNINNDQKNDNFSNYQYYNTNILFRKGNHFEDGEEEEKSDDTIVAFQEEKNSNLLDSTNENEIDLNNNTEYKYNNLNNEILSKKSSGVFPLKNKKKKKKKKRDKNKRIQILAHDKDKLRQVNLSNLLKKIKIGRTKKQTKKSEMNLKINLDSNMIKSRSLTKSINQMEDKMNGKIELSPSKIIYENGLTDDEDEMKRIIKKKMKKKINLKPIITPYLQSIKDKNEYNIRLQKIRQQFTEKKFFHEQKFFYYVLKPGNGAILVKDALKHRTNWKEAQMNVTSLFNFKWQTSTLCIDYKKLSSVESIPQMVNHFECHSVISNKSNMFLNLFEYCESHNINIWKYVPLTIFISKDNENEKYFDNLYDNINKYIINYNDINKNLNENKNEEKYSNLFKTMKCNIYGRRKNIIKDTWMMGSKTPLQIPDTHCDGKNFWVLKASNLNRGQCIRLVDSKEKFHEIIKDWSQGINLKGSNKGTTDNNILFNQGNNQNKGDEIPMSDTYITEKIIVQKYIEKPLCYYGRKCDMRVWVLLNQDMKVFVYKEGHLKTCSEKFDINNNKDAFIHITNYSFQKHCLNFQKYELGNEVPFHDFQRFLDIEYKDKKANVKEYIMNQVKYIIELTMKSVKDKINPNKSKYCFEIFGYDFMMDVNLNVYLIEINTNPGIEISSPWIKAIIPRMVDDALRLTIDKVFPIKYQFDENAITEINYEDYSNDLTNKNKIEENKKVEEKTDESAKIIKKKKYTTICDQGSGTQDKNDEKYIQENIRKQKIKIQKKTNDADISSNNNKLEDSKINENKISINDINKEKVNQNNNYNINNKKDKEIKKEGEKEKEFDQKDYKSPFPVPGYEPWENVWELVCDLNEEKPENNYSSGVKYLLEIQKKRQAILSPNDINLNKKSITKNNINNNINHQKDKNAINKNNNNENKSNNNINNKEVKKINKNNEQEKKIENKKIKQKNEKKIIEKKNGEKKNDDKKNDKKENKDIKIKEEKKNEELENENYENEFENGNNVKEIENHKIIDNEEIGESKNINDEKNKEVIGNEENKNINGNEKEKNIYDEELEVDSDEVDEKVNN